MLYNFLCKECGHEQSAMFPGNDYDDYVTNDGKLKRTKCEECGNISLYRHIKKAPEILGGTKGYMSMERWQEKNPDHVKRKEDELSKKLEERHRKKVMDQIDKQKKRISRDQRHKGYGKGHGEEKLKPND